jgi:hypothetical protein
MAKRGTDNTKDGFGGESFPDEPPSGGSDECEACQWPLKGVLTLPWEDGDNPHAYVTCSRCRHRNIKYGFGGDD